MGATEWAGVIIGGLIILYFAATIAGRGFGRGYFEQRRQYNDEFLSKLDRRSNNGTEEQ